MIVVEKLCVRAGGFVLSDISFEIPTGCYGALMGRTACGKTTILETICGLKRADSGRIILDGRDITQLKPAERGVSYVPQDGALFSTMSVGEQLGFALSIRKRPRAEVKQRVGELAALLGVEHLLERKVQGLSGGERQRVALGRALAARPRILCLDEPLSSLDEDTRSEMYEVLETACHQAGVTTLHVTHSMSEALKLAERIFRIEDGSVHLLEGQEGMRNSP